MINRYIFVFLLSVIFTIPVDSQIGVFTDTPHQSAALDISSTTGGVAIPRLTTSNKEAIVSPASGLIVYDTDKKCLSVNTGTPASPLWICMTQNHTRFFYMPSINVPTPNVGAVAAPLDLYARYVSQFSSPMYKSLSAPTQIPYHTSPDRLYYYITYYDKNVLNINSISNDGKVNYSVVRKADYDSYMNVVFVIK